MSRLSSWAPWLEPVAKRFAMALVLTFTAIATFPTSASEILSRPGEMVDAGTHRLHIYCKGNGDLTVVIDAGLGDSSLEWLNVQAALSSTVRVCIYDRAGYGWSQPGPSPRTSSRIANELFVILKQAAVPAPYVLVGHSYGGYNMQLFATRYPYVTAGVVLVDSSHSEQVERFLAPPIGLNTAPSGKLTQVRFSRHRLPRHLPAEIEDTVRSQLWNQRARKTVADEYLNFRQSALQVRESAAAFPKVPIVVLTRGKRVWPHTKRGDLIERLWLELQTELAERSPYSVHMLADRSGHHIHLEQPELVVAAIGIVLDVVRVSCVGLQGIVDVKPYHHRPGLAFRHSTWYSDSLYTRPMPGVQYPVRLSRAEFLAANYVAWQIHASHQQTR